MTGRIIIDLSFGDDQAPVKILEGATYCVLKELGSTLKSASNENNMEVQGVYIETIKDTYGFPVDEVLNGGLGETT